MSPTIYEQALAALTTDVARAIERQFTAWSSDTKLGRVCQNVAGETALEATCLAASLPCCLVVSFIAMNAPTTINDLSHDEIRDWLERALRGQELLPRLTPDESSYLAVLRLEKTLKPAANP